MLQLIIANQLRDGFVVFLTEDGAWSKLIADGALATDEAGAKQLIKQAKAAELANKVIDPYLIDIEIAGGQRIPTDYREFIRASGPTVPIPA